MANESLALTAKQIRDQIGAKPPIFDPSEDHSPQVEAWKAWSANMRLADKFDSQKNVNDARANKQG